MKKHDLSRRKFIQHTAVATSSVYLLPATAFAQKNNEKERYQPQYFTAEEWDFINAITDQLIPEDELGGGLLLPAFQNLLIVKC